MKADEPRLCTCQSSDQLVHERLGGQGRSKKAAELVKVTCSACGRVFWTNGESDLCFDCKKRNPPVASDQESRRRGQS